MTVDRFDDPDAWLDDADYVSGIEAMNALDDEEDDAPETISEHDALIRYEEMLDEVYGNVTIGGYEYTTYHALRVIDPIAFRCGFNDWLDAEGIEVE